VILGRLRFSNEETAQILALVKNHMKFGDVMGMRESTLKRFFRLENFREHLALHWLDASSCHADLRLYEFARTRFEAEPEESVRPKLLVTGKELIAAGYRPGTEFKAMLDFGGGCATGGHGDNDGRGVGAGARAIWRPLRFRLKLSWVKIWPWCSKWRCAMESRRHIKNPLIMLRASEDLWPPRNLSSILRLDTTPIPNLA